MMSTQRDVTVTAIIPQPFTDKREALLRAALELFAERTFSAAAVPDIAARAHVGPGTVFRHFESKASLANELYRELKNSMHEALLSALERGGSDKQRFLGMWQSLAAMAEANPLGLRFLELHHHDEYLDDDSSALSLSVFGTAERFIRSAQEAGAVRDGNASVVIALVFGAFVGLFKEACKGRYALDHETIESAGELAWRMIAT